jgi:hypothetical protein
MNKTRIALLTVLLSGVLAGAGSAATSVSVGVQVGSSGRSTVDIGFFYDDLAPYGNWVERPQYGWVWTPRAVASTWHPYQEGHWVWTDEGWTWISDEPYGWATYHYGRWYEDPDYGWEWIPGDEYAPAWVSWQESDDYIGWAPLPPSVNFRVGPLNVSLSPETYVFVPTRQFLAPRISQYAVPRAERDRIFVRTRNVTDYQIVNRRVVNRGISVDRIQRVVGRAVPRYQVADVGADQRHRGPRVAQNRLSVFRPEVRKVRVAPPPSRAAARRSVIAAPQARVAAPGRMSQPARPQERTERPQPSRQPEARRIQTPEARVRPIKPPKTQGRPEATQNGRIQPILRQPDARPQQTRQARPVQRQPQQPRMQQQPQTQGQNQGQNKGRGQARPQARQQGKPPGGNGQGKQKNKEGHGHG